MQQPLFTLNVTAAAKNINIDNLSFSLQGLKAKDAYTLWSKGFSGVEMTRTGAQRLLGAATPSELSELILRLAKTSAEVNAIRSLAPQTAVVRNAAKARLEQLAALAVVD
jgi:hypothetical protein